ncbi:hypothetical protein D3H65_20625 [Paraflavitalea soli]|uniref:Lipocalin-like domain-containing protein n=1 Tax=Paraflavitalea soli TaxID=2315862 RepID=A0A3B7MQ20_9BACT|nr:lipocalin family protein [Paraflavitalea soli]AXY76248.1 hypothetical protein D3H65_20625 [Paraflavitalea soli]
MKKTSIRLVLAIAFSAMLFTACKKDKDEAVAASKENLIGSYKLTEARAKVLTQDLDVLDTYVEACQKDDVYVLNADFTAKIKDEGTKCGNGEGYTSSWELDGNYIDIDGYSGNIKSFDGKTLVIEASGTQSGITATLTFKFAKQ